MTHTEASTEVLPKALLVGIEYPQDAAEEANTLLQELVELVQNLDIEVASKVLVRLKKPNPKFLLGFGKAEELAKQAKSLCCNKIIFDDELSPAQQRNWEALTGLEVLDRNEIILDIFARRAQTKEASLQVELARLEYMLPRLRKAWTHLHRQRGGGAVQRGEGETQLEVDQRLVRKRIARLKHELAEVVQHRSIQRQKRMRVPIPSGAIVGYTNAGKSSLLNRLTGAQALVENKLFATLDPKTRKLQLPCHKDVLLTDTVGFVRRLPHRLVEAFKATLEEAVVSDFLIHVIDFSSPDAEAHISTTLKVLKELGADEKPLITVFNKADLSQDPILCKTLRHDHPEAIIISTKTGEGIDLLIEKITTVLGENIQEEELLIPYTRYDLINALYELGVVQRETPEEDGVHVFSTIPKRLKDTLQTYIIKHTGSSSDNIQIA